MPDGVAGVGRDREDEVADAGQMLVVEACGAAPGLVPAIQQLQLAEEDSRLDRVEPRRVALVRMLVLAQLAVLAERAEILRRVEAERGAVPDSAGAPTVAYGAVGLAGVFDERDAVALGQAL